MTVSVFGKRRRVRRSDDGVLPAAVDGWIERLRLIPDAERSYTISLHAAAATFSIEEPLARELIARGLPCGWHEREPRFCLTDLHYVGLRIGRATTHRTAMRLWTSALTEAAEGDGTDAEVRCSPYGRPGLDVEVLVPPGRWEQATIGPNRLATSFTVHRPGRWPPFDPRLDDLLREVAALDFCLMPGDLYARADFARETGMADCGSAAALLAEECTRLGVEARRSFGLLLARPYATVHHWADIRAEDGQWVAADPLLLALLADHTDLDADVWPHDRSPGSVLVRVAEQQVPLVRNGEQPLEASFLVRPRS
jgi:transglutaminase superfamily protein